MKHVLNSFASFMKKVIAHIILKIIPQVIVILFLQGANAQVPDTLSKHLPAVRLKGTIKIDGDVSDSAWNNAPVAKNFVEENPNNNRPENYASRTEVKILYDDYYIYIGGYCHENTSDSVQRELVGRDAIGSNDFVGVIFDTYYDKINASGFYVTPLGEQLDAKYSNTNGEDKSWNAVWDSEAKIVSDGWTFEMRIPYSALRFSKNTKVWGLQINRKRSKLSQQLNWNPILATVNGFVNQEGAWTGIENIKPPLRLSFSPYISGYINHYPYNLPGVKNTTQSINGGMDLKYGINQNYTLDMTLVPDFGQVASDKKVLNLSPFEVQYNENRPFFTEGLELFSKGDLFYSRRIGGEPLHKNEADLYLMPGQTIINNPTESKLINATKISGRNQSGLGLGFFNAVTQAMYATAEDDITHAKSKIKTSSLTNYNIVVADQTLKHNSSISLINTSVLRAGSDYDAVVSAGIFDFNDSKNNFNLSGKVALSNLVFSQNTITGYSHRINVSKNNGRFNYSLTQEIANEKYNINDLGILFNNNYLDHYAYMGYKWIKPNKLFNNLYLNYSNYLSYRYTDGKYQSAGNNIRFNSQLKNLWRVGGGVGYNFRGNDFYEPRVPGKFFHSSAGFSWNSFFSSNGAKKYYADASLRGNIYPLLNGNQLYFGVGQRYRFNSKFSLGTNFTINVFDNNLGFADVSNGDVIFSRRKRKTSVNDLNAKYNFNNKMGINLAVRHYWSQVKVNQFYALQDNGELVENNTYNKNKNYNVNLFNIDMVYTWQVAPGSFLNIVWKNSISDFNKDITHAYFKNFYDTFQSDQNNNVSVKFLYYLDYNDIRKKFKG